VEKGLAADSDRLARYSGINPIASIGRFSWPGERRLYILVIMARCLCTANCPVRGYSGFQLRCYGFLQLHGEDACVSGQEAEHY
jgi:hypothetical protein